jgi:hypothetical protein
MKDMEGNFCLGTFLRVVVVWQLTVIVRDVKIRRCVAGVR